MPIHRARKAPPVRNIEGEAIVLERRPGTAHERPRPEPQPLNDNAAPPFFAFPEHRRSRADLLYPGAVRWRPAPAAPQGLWRTKRAGTRTLAALAAGLAALCVGLATAYTPAGPKAPAAAFSLSETATHVARRGSERVLSVEGRIRNESPRAAFAPGVVVRLGPARLRAFRPTEAVVRPGASVFFHSTLALPSFTSAENAVLSLEAAPAKGSTSRP